MAEAVIMPRQGQTVESCIITKWHKKEGDEVKAGDLLFTYETDKSTFDEEAKVEGYVLKIFYDEDDDVPCLETVCIIGQKGEDISKFLKKERKAIPAAPEKEQAQAAAPAVEGGQRADEGATSYIKISRRAKNLAEKLGIDYSKAIPTGAEGRIIERDIEALASDGVLALRERAADAKEAPATPEKFVYAPAAPAQAPSYVDEKISNMRKTIARAMMNSLQTTAQLTHTASFDATEILEFRKKIKPLSEKGELNNITINDIIMFVVSRVLKRHRAFNAHMLGDTIRYYSDVNLAMAVDTPRGLMVPVCFNADKKSLNQLAGELKALASECQKGTISPDLLSGGSFTVSNLGIYGTESFTPILNAPQTGILGVGCVVTRVREAEGQLKPYPCMTLSLTYDHRAVDGAGAAKFLQDICKSLENFTVTLATN